MLYFNFKIENLFSVSMFSGTNLSFFKQLSDQSWMSSCNENQSLAHEEDIILERVKLFTAWGI